jgi:hypothetical protein
MFVPINSCTCTPSNATLLLSNRCIVVAALVIFSGKQHHGIDDEVALRDNQIPEIVPNIWQL